MIPKMDFGRTGHASTRVIFGGYTLSQATQAEADRVLALLLEYGINHIDVARMYGDAEERIGPWMKKYREKFFLWCLPKRAFADYHGRWYGYVTGAAALGAGLLLFINEGRQNLRRLFDYRWVAVGVVLSVLLIDWQIGMFFVPGGICLTLAVLAVRWLSPKE